MKKLTAILAAFIMFFSASSFAGDDTVSAKIKSEFSKNFNSAEYVSWKKSDGIYFATFKIQEQNFSAAYNDEGELLGVSRTISFSQLPLSVSLAIQNKYKGYSFNESLFEVNHEGQTTYYFTAENAKHILNLTSDSSGDLTIQTKTRKK